MIFDLLEIMQINFNGVDLAFGCRRIAFEWEGFDIESFHNDKSMYVCVYIWRERDLCHSGRYRGRILPTQIQPYDIRMQDPLR